MINDSWTYSIFKLQIRSIFNSVKFLQTIFDETEQLAEQIDAVLDAFNCEDFEEYEKKANKHLNNLLFHLYTEFLTIYEVFIRQTYEVMKKEPELTKNHKKAEEWLTDKLKIVEEFNDEYSDDFIKYYEVRNAILHRNKSVSLKIDLSRIKGLEIRTFGSESAKLKSISIETLFELEKFILRVTKFINSKLPNDFDEREFDDKK